MSSAGMFNGARPLLLSLDMMQLDRATQYPATVTRRISGLTVNSFHWGTYEKDSPATQKPSKLWLYRSYLFWTFSVLSVDNRVANAP